MNPLPPASLRDWLRDLGRRLVTLWPIKATGTMCWIAGFFVAYFWVLRNPVAEVTVMPLTTMDRFVAFRSEALILYASLWVYVSLPPAILKNFRELFSYGAATLALSAIGLGIFLVWPTAVPPFEIDLAQHPSISLIKGVDLPGNACPSLHVAFAVFTSIWIDRILREMRSHRAVLIGNWVWCVSIVYSTLATRQHVVLDVIAGALLGAVVAWLHLRAVRWVEGVSAAAATPLPGRAGEG
ncbi:MAG TPA: phosphatase PAP2 family protein [Burkholderiaceae bacterium]|nr:phosphatase PAP2 family protein [Burkholderiaceae bacterium]